MICSSTGQNLAVTLTPDGAQIAPPRRRDMSALVLPACVGSFIDTEAWIGSAYTPARAANTLWWSQFNDYEADIQRELSAARQVLRLPVLRVFLHTLAFEALGAARHAEHVERFLSIAHENGIRVGFVLFGDSWFERFTYDGPSKGREGFARHVLTAADRVDVFAVGGDKVAHALWLSMKLACSVALNANG